MTEVQKVRVEVSSDQTEAWVDYDHFSHGDFGRSSRVAHWKLPIIFEGGRLLSLRAGVLDYPTLISGSCGTFELGAEYTFTDALWKVRMGTRFPYKISLELEDVGKTSLTVFSKLVNKLDNKTLATFRGRIVHVNLKTRRPTSLPQWMLDKYKGVSRPGAQPLNLPKSAPNIPDTAFDYSLIVGACDVDYNGHVNQAAYFRYCSDAAQAAVKEGRLPGFLPDIDRFPLQKATAVFTGETNDGDRLRLSLWQPNGRQDLVQCVIKKEVDNQPIVFHGSMTYGLIPVTSAQL